MTRRRIAWIAVTVVAVAAAGFAGWLVTLPPARPAIEAPLIAKEETDATVAALKPPKRQRPLIAIIGINDATEVTDYLMPFGVLRRADIADVLLLATEPGVVKLYPALQVEPHATIATFDAQHPDGADYVIVPAMSRDDDPTALQWIRSQATKGATIVGVCAGAKVVGSTGLLDGKRATTHWFYVEELLAKHPTITYVANRRVVVDENVATTTGIAASMPIALTLVEAMAGRSRAEAVGRSIGLPSWDDRHDSGAFRFTRPFAVTAIRNTVTLWNREQLGIALTPGIDEVSLALVADAWSRTYRSRAVTFAGTDGARPSANGVRVVPDQVAASWPAERLVPAVGDRRPASALDDTLDGIAARYGTPTADFVAMQLEYPRRDNP